MCVVHLLRWTRYAFKLSTCAYSVYQALFSPFSHAWVQARIGPNFSTTRLTDCSQPQQHEQGRTIHVLCQWSSSYPQKLGLQVCSVYIACINVYKIHGLQVLTLVSTYVLVWHCGEYDWVKRKQLYFQDVIKAVILVWLGLLSGIFFACVLANNC